MIHKSMLAGVLAVTLLCAPMQVQAAQADQTNQTEQAEQCNQTTDSAQTTGQEAGAAADADSTQTENAAYYTVRFESNRGTMVKTTITLRPGDKYGTLPKTSREGYRFKGWYTKKQGGTKVTAATRFRT